MASAAAQPYGRIYGICTVHLQVFLKLYICSCKYSIMQVSISDTNPSCRSEVHLTTIISKFLGHFWFFILKYEYEAILVL